MLFVRFLFTTILLCPIIAFVLTLIVCRMLRLDKHKAIGYSADVTTGLLFFAVPIAIRNLWGVSIFIPLFVSAFVVAIIFTYIDWRTKKEIEVKPLLKKVWRVYFILLGITYFLVWVIGLTHSVIIFMMVD